MIDIIIYAVIFSVLGFAAYAVIKSGIYNMTSHSIYDDCEKLRENAEIITVTREIIGGRKSIKRYRTILTFDDGFKFISHKTNTENGVFTYTISIGEVINQEILNDAIEAHKKMIEKCRKKKAK